MQRKQKVFVIWNFYSKKIYLPKSIFNSEHVGPTMCINIYATSNSEVEVGGNMAHCLTVSTSPVPR